MILDFCGNTGGGFDRDALLGRFVPKRPFSRTLRTSEKNGEFRAEDAGPRRYALVALPDRLARAATVIDGASASELRVGSGLA